MINFLLCLIIIILLINTLITNITIRKIIKDLENPQQKQKPNKIKQKIDEYRTFIKRWGKF